MRRRLSTRNNHMMAYQLSRLCWVVQKAHKEGLHVNTLTRVHLDDIAAFPEGMATAQWKRGAMTALKRVVHEVTGLKPRKNVQKRDDHPGEEPILPMQFPVAHPQPKGKYSEASVQRRVIFQGECPKCDVPALEEIHRVSFYLCSEMRLASDSCAWLARWRLKVGILHPYFKMSFLMMLMAPLLYPPTNIAKWLRW